MPPSINAAAVSIVRQRVDALTWPDGGMHLCDFAALTLYETSEAERAPIIKGLERDGAIWIVNDFAGERVFPSSVRPKEPGRKSLESLGLVPSGLSHTLRLIAGDVAQIAFHAKLASLEDAEEADRYEFRIIAKAATRRIADAVAKAERKGYSLDKVRKYLARAIGPGMREALRIAAPWLVEGAVTGIPVDRPAKRTNRKAGIERAIAELSEAGHNGLGRRELHRRAFPNDTAALDAFIATGAVIEFTDTRRNPKEGGRRATRYRLATFDNSLNPFA